MEKRQQAKLNSIQFNQIMYNIEMSSLSLTLTNNNGKISYLNLHRKDQQSNLMTKSLIVDYIVIMMFNAIYSPLFLLVILPQFVRHLIIK